MLEAKVALISLLFEPLVAPHLCLLTGELRTRFVPFPSLKLSQERSLISPPTKKTCLLKETLTNGDDIFTGRDTGKRREKKPRPVLVGQIKRSCCCIIERRKLSLALLCHCVSYTSLAIRRWIRHTSFFFFLSSVKTTEKRERDL